MWTEETRRPSAMGEGDWDQRHRCVTIITGPTGEEQ